MSRRLVRIGVGVVLVAVAIGEADLRAQSPSTSGAGDGPGQGESISLDGDAQVPITIRGLYVRAEPAKRPAGPIHRISACGTVIDLDLSTNSYDSPQTKVYRDNLRAYLDKGHLTSGKSRIAVRGLLANAPAGDGSSRLVCRVTGFQVLRGEESRPAAAATRPDATKEEYRILADRINAERGLSILFRPERDPQRSILALIRGAGLRVSSDSLPEAGVINCEVKGPDGVSPSLVQSLKESPAKPKIVPWSSTARQPTISLPAGERPFSTDAGRPG